MEHLAGEPRVAVVGGGISGLAAAFHLERAGCQVDVIERSDLLGGRFGVAVLGERPVMLGGKNIGRRYQEFRKFTAALGNHDYEPFGINTSRVGGGRLHTFDSSRLVRSLRNQRAVVAGHDFMRLAGLAARVRAREINRFLGSPLFTRLSERYDSNPLSYHFESNTISNLLRPLTVRMNGGEPGEMYLGTLGTNLALLVDTFDQLTQGIQPVLDRMVGLVNVRLETMVESLVLEGNKVTGLRAAQAGAPADENRYDAVVLAVPASAAAPILRESVPALGRALEKVRYFPTTVALVQYDRPAFAPAIRALAMDDGPCSNAGAYGRDDRHIVRYTFSGREARGGEPPSARVQEWIDQGEEGLRRQMPASAGGRRVVSISRYWREGYCAYVPFHGRFLSDVAQHVAGVGGLALAGDYLKGASLEACCRSGCEAGAKLANELARVAA